MCPRTGSVVVVVVVDDVVVVDGADVLVGGLEGPGPIGPGPGWAVGTVVVVVVVVFTVQTLLTCVMKQSWLIDS
jgi:hypothetical protein